MTDTAIVRYPVPSTNIAAIGYDPETRRLHVEFQPSAKKGEPLPTRGKVVEYRSVPPELFEAFAGAPSKGKFFHTAIRGKEQFAGKPVDVPAMGKCPKCGDLGLAGCKCEECGCDDYTE